MNKFKIYSFSNSAGHEYVIISTDSDFNIEDNTIHGYTLDRVLDCETDGAVDLLPLDYTLTRS